MPLKESIIKYEQAYPRSRPKKHGAFSCFGLIIGLLIIVIVMGLVVVISIKLAINPIKEQVDNLPADFPTDLAIYQMDQAKIETYSQTARQKIIKLANLLPDWIVNPALSYIADDLSQQLSNTYGNFATTTNLNLDDLKNALGNKKLKDTQTLSLKWDNLQIDQDELLSYYKQQLSQSDYAFKEDIRDYEINLGFWKDGVFGNLNLKPDQNNTDAQMTVNYFNSTDSYDNFGN